MKKALIFISIFCVFLPLANIFAFPDICIPGMCDGDLHDSSDVKQGTFSNWIGRADSTSSGEWSYNTPLGVVESDDADGSYVFDLVNISSEASYTGTAYFPDHPEYGTSSYSMQLNLTFPGGYCEGTWSIDFTDVGWEDMNGYWYHTNRYTSPMTNHVDSIYIDVGVNHEEPDDSEIYYEFTFEIVSDNAVNLVSVTTPGSPGVASGITFDIPPLPSQYDEVNQIWTNYEYDPEYDVYFWEYSKEAALMSDLDSYGDGWYTVTVYYSGGGSDSTQIWFGVPTENVAIPQPAQEPVITSHTNRQIATNPVTLVWNECSDTNADSIWLCVEKMMGDEEYDFMFSTTDTSYELGWLSNGFWEVCLSFDNFYSMPHNSDGILYDVGKYSESNLILGVGVVSEITGDDIVNLEDFAKFAMGWLDEDCHDGNDYCGNADLNFDEEVNHVDLRILCNDWLDSPELPLE